MAGLLNRVTTTRPWFIFLVSWMAIGGMSILWACTSPIGAGMDEPSHYIKAASVVRGQLLGTPGERPQDRIVQVPQMISTTLEVSCLAFKADVTGSCIGPVGSSTQIVDENTSAGLYNPVYYVLVGWPSLLDVGPSALYLMRFVSAIVCSFFFAVAITFLAQLRRTVLPVLAGFAVITPTTMFLSGLINPNAFEIATTAAFLAALLYAANSPAKRANDLWTSSALAVSGAFLANARGLSPAWLGLAVVIVAISVGVGPFVRRMMRPPMIVAVVIVTLSLVLATVWALKTNSLAAVGEYPGVGSTFSQGFLTMLASTIEYLRQAFGLFGWLDSPAPTWVPTLGYVLLATVTVFALLFARRTREWAALWVALAAFIFVPPLVQASSVTVSGYVWQGRYNLPLIVLLVLMAAVVASERFSGLVTRDGRKIVVFVLVVTTLAQLVSVLTNLKRYVVGATPEWNQFFSAPQWSPPLLPAWLWFVLSIVVAVLYLLACSTVILSLSRRRTALA